MHRSTIFNKRNIPRLLILVWVIFKQYLEQMDFYLNCNCSVPYTMDNLICVSLGNFSAFTASLHLH